MTFLAFAILFITSLIGLALTLLTLPGVWLILLIALICQFALDLYSWWTLAVAFALAILGELAEFGASALGATGAGGGFAGAIGSIIGSTIGAIVGTFALPIPIAGTIAGGVLGAGLGALAAERGYARRTWGHSYRIGRGAAIGRLIATVAKLTVALAVAILLTVAVFF